jgi:hypothetical protein
MLITMPNTVSENEMNTDKTDHSCDLAEHKLNLFCDKSQDDISVCEKIDIQASSLDKDKSRDMLNH